MNHSLIPLYRQMHAQGAFDGRSTYGFAEHIAKLVRSTGASTLLDYGSGKGRQYLEGRIHELWGGIMPTLYDPGWRPNADRPVGQFDGVICIDVLEHIPEEELNETLEDIRCYARSWVFFAIGYKPANKNLPDGRNAHVTIHDPAWWRTRLDSAFHLGPKVHIGYKTLRKNQKPSTLRKCPKDVYLREGWRLPPSYR